MPRRSISLRSPLCAVFLVAAMGAPALAGQDQPAEGREAQLSALLECREVTGDAERLACFDSTSAAFGSRTDLVVIDRGQIEQAEREGFGFNMPSLGPLASLFDREARSDASRASELEVAQSSEGGAQVVRRDSNGAIEEIELEIERVTTSGYQTQRLHMTNGQVWVVNDEVPRRRLGVREGSTAVIRRAALGSYLAQIDGTGRAYRVSRER